MRTESGSVTSDRALRAVPSYCPRCGMSRRLGRVMVFSALIEGMVMGVAIALGLLFLAYGPAVIP